MSKTTDLTELAAVPASGDFIPIVDVSDTTHAASGTTKRVSIANLLNDRINVKAYGAVGDGETDDTTAIQSALDVAASNATGIQKGTTVVFPAGDYVVTSPLNLCNRSDMKLVGAGGMTYNTRIIGKTTDKAVIEMIGAQDITIEHLAIQGDASDTPAIGIWTARSSVNLNASRIYFRDVYIYGSFSLACWLNCGSESNHWDHCYTYPSNAGCDAGILFDYRNALSGITPDNATLNLTYDIAICRVFNSYLTAAATATSFIPIYVYAGYAPTVKDSYLVSWGGPIFYLRGGCGNGLRANNLAIEGTPTYILHISDDGTYNVPGKVSRFHFEKLANPVVSSGYVIYADDNVVVRDSSIEDCSFADDIRFYDIEGCKFTRWGAYSSTAYAMTVAHNAADSYIYLNYNDTLTISGSSFNVIVDSDSGTAPQPFILVNKSLQIGSTYGAASLASISSILTASTTWDPASLADGASATTFLAVSADVAVDGKWIAWASLSTMIAQGWMITAHPYGGGVVVTIMNRTGGTVDLGSGTLRVVAMKVA